MPLIKFNDLVDDDAYGVRENTHSYEYSWRLQGIGMEGVCVCYK